MSGRGSDRTKRIRPTKSEWNMITGQLASLAVDGKIALTEDQVKYCAEDLNSFGVNDVVTTKDTRRGNTSCEVGGSGVTFIEWSDWSLNPVYNMDVVRSFGEVPTGTILVIKNRKRGRPSGSKQKLIESIRVEEEARRQINEEE